MPMPMPTFRTRSLLGRCGALLAFALLALLVVPPAPAAARGGARVTDFDREVDREINAQDRHARSAKTKGQNLKGLVRRYNHRLLDDRSALNQFLLGRAYGLDEQLDLAARHLAEAVRLKPDFHQALFRLAVIAFRKNDVKAAEQYLDRALAFAPQQPGYLDMKCKLCLARQEYAQAKKLAEALLRVDSTNDEARGMLGAAYMGLKDWKNAQRVFTMLIRKNPKALPLRAQWIDCAMHLEQWDQAISETRTLLSVAPKDPTLRRMLVRAYMGKGDTAGAAKVLRSMVEADPKDWSARRVLAEVLLSENNPVGAHAELEIVLRQLAALPPGPRVAPLHAEALQMAAFCSLAEAQGLVRDEKVNEASALLERAVGYLQKADRLHPLPAHMLDRLQVSLARLGRHKERIPYLKRMQATLTGRPEDATRLGELIKLLESGKSEAAPGELSAESQLEDLIRRCTHENVAVRRQALHEYYDRNFPFVDPVIYQRHDHRIEPDAICRFWVVRILGRFQAGTANPEIVRIAARYVGLALEDPASSVRRGAAEALGSIGSPAGVLYILPHLSAMPIDTAPKTESAKDDLEREFNATREALIQLTGRTDYEIGGERWVRLAKAVENRARWRAWFDTPPGIAKRLEGLADLAAVTDVDPRWQLRYILVDVIQDKPPAPPAVALKSYQVLRDRIQALPSERRLSDPWWKTFPLFEDARVNDAGLPAIRKALRAWWPPKPASSGAGDKGGK